MRALEVQSPGTFALVERPDPSPASDELLVAPEAVGICATDVEIIDGVLAYFRNGLASYPIVPGHEWSGHVLAVGSAIASFSPGDVVVAETVIGCGSCTTCLSGRQHLCRSRRELGIMGLDGAMATRITVPARAVHPVPSSISVVDAALIEPAAVGLYAARRVGCRDRTVLILGVGPIGLFALQSAKVEGASVLVAADVGRSDRLEMARRLGADDTVMLREASWGRRAAELLSSIGSEGVEVVLECSGGWSALQLAVAVAAPAGTIGVVGLSGRPTVPVDADALVLKDLSLVGIGGSPGVWPDTIELFVSGGIEAKPLITHRFALEQAGDAFDLVRRHAPGAIKVIVQPQQ